MRKIEKLMIDAIIARKPFQQDNTIVSVYNDGYGEIISVALHGNIIAKTGKRFECITLAGWNTTTTKSRLHALLISALSMPVRLRTHKGTCQYMDTRQPDIWHDLPSNDYLVYDKRTGDIQRMNVLPRYILISM